MIFTVKDTFAFALTGTLVFDCGSLSFVLFVLQILSFLPPNLHASTNRTHRNLSAASQLQAPTHQIFSSINHKKGKKNVLICLSRALPSTPLPTFCLAHQTLQIRHTVRHIV